jgi:mitochondrial import inner membrane translocase subunit TIM10
MKSVPFNQSLLTSWLRLIDTCTLKCIPKDFHEGELNKGESVCIDRCVSKFLDATIKANEKVKNDAVNAQAGGSGGGSMFGF